MMVQVDLFLTLIPKIMKKASLNFILFFLFLQYSNASTKSILLVDLDGDGTKDFVTIAQDNKTQFNKINNRGYYGSPENSLFEQAITLYPYSVISSTYDNALKSAIEDSITLNHWQNYWNSSTRSLLEIISSIKLHIYMQAIKELVGYQVSNNSVTYSMHT